MKTHIHKILRVQGSDAELITALNANAAEGWELVQLVASGGFQSTSATAENKWIVILRKEDK